MSRLEPDRGPDFRRPYGREPRQMEPPRELPRLQDSDRKALQVVGSFRIVNAKEIASSSVRRLLDKGLVQRRTMHPGKGRPPLMVLSLTRKGRATLEAARTPGDRQRYWTASSSPRKSSTTPASTRLTKRKQRRSKRRAERSSGS